LKYRYNNQIQGARGATLAAAAKNRLQRRRKHFVM
jgi:hypothetical protein